MNGTLAKLATLALLIAALAVAREAAAAPQVELSVIPAPESKEQSATQTTLAPQFRAVVKEAPPGLAADAFRLKQVDAVPPIVVEPSEVRSYIESDDPMALVVLVEGDAAWMGNERYRDEADPERVVGAWSGVGPALDELSTAGPPGSLAALLLYHGITETRLPMGDLSQLSSGVLGEQQSFEENFSTSLLTGIDEAYNLLVQQAGKRRVLIIMGDGRSKSDGEDLTGRIRETKKKLKELGVEVYTLRYPAGADDPSGAANFKQLGSLGAAVDANTREDIASRMKSVVTALGARYYVAFPGRHEQSGRYFDFDGKEHEYALEVGGESIEGIYLASPLIFTPAPEDGGSLWWLWLLLGLLLTAVVAVILLKRRAAAPPVAAVAPVPAPSPQSNKTLLVNPGGDGGFPIVGWIVPLSGASQYQTFKLQHGVTSLGTGEECHVVVPDTFMSTEHAQIVCAGDGFVLKDNGSTNGTFVNDKRVSAHPLIDNDVFTMGQTDFKFKSIN